MRYRALIGFAAGWLLAHLALGQQNNDPRGNFVSSRANQALEQCFDATGAFLCGGGVAGTAGHFAVFSGGGVTDSVLTDDGVDVTLPAIPSSFNFVDSTFAIARSGTIWQFANTNDPGSIRIEAGSPANSMTLISPLGATGNTLMRWTGQSGPLDGNDFVFGVSVGYTVSPSTGAGNQFTSLQVLQGSSRANVDQILLELSAPSAVASVIRVKENSSNWTDLTFATPTSANAIDFPDDSGSVSLIHSDGTIRPGQVAHAALPAAPDGSMIFCTDCDPGSTPCTTGGASTGNFAFRENGAWNCK